MMIDNTYAETLPATEARAVLRRILRKAYKASGILTIDGMERMIHHAPACHASATKLPWPFSMLEIHDVAICHFKSNDQVGESRRFAKREIDFAIEEFLTGAKPTDMVKLHAEL